MRVLQSPSIASLLSGLNFRVLAGVAIIVVVVFIVYLPSISGGFIFDDDTHLTNNPLIKSSNLLEQFWIAVEKQIFPISHYTLWIEWRLWGLNPIGYHITNLILHIVESLLIWLILRNLSVPGAFLAALIFAVHPVNVESVAWISQRKNLMSMLFFLLSILCYLKLEIPLPFTQNSLYRVPSPLAPRPSSLFYWLSLAAFVLAMFSKGSVAILPVLLLGIIWYRRSLMRRDIVLMIPFFLVALVLTGLNLWYHTYSHEPIRTVTFTERLLGAGGVVWFYLYKALLPFDLVFIYPQWKIQAGNMLWWLPLGAVLVITAMLWQYRNGWGRPFLFAWGFFCVALVPVLGFADTGFMQYSLVSDHYQHIAIIGVISLVAAGCDIWRKCVRGAPYWAAMLVVYASVGVLAFLTWQQSGLYSDKITLYQTTLNKNPDCWVLHNNLGCILGKAGRSQEAIKHLMLALSLNPDYPDAQSNLGNALVDTGQLDEAIKHYEEALQLKPDYVGVHNNLSIALIKTGRFHEAIAHCRHAIRLQPYFAEAHYNMSMALAGRNSPQAAIGEGKRALELARLEGNAGLAKKIEDWLNFYNATMSGNATR